MKKKPTITVLELPQDADPSSLLLEIPKDCNQLGEKLEKAYFVSLHSNGNGIFVSDKPTASRQVFPIYPSPENPLRNWKVLEYQIKQPV